MAAGWASPAGVPGINQRNRHADPLRLVGDKSPELVKRPTMPGSPLRASSRYPVAYPAQVFECDGASGVLRFGYQMLTNFVINVSGKPSLLARKFFESALGRLRAFGLEFGPQAAVTIAHMVDLVPGVNFAV